MTLRIAFLLALLASFAGAKTTLDIDPGFGGRFRSGRWAPVYVTVQSDAPHTAELSLHVANASGSAMTIRQAIGVGTQKQTYIVYAPLSMMDDPLRATLSDIDTLKPLAHWPEDPSAANSRFGFGGEQVGFMVVSSGRSPMMAGFTRSNVSGPSIVTNLQPKLLPEAAVGYDAIDVLALNHPDLEAITPEQQQAILNWINSGGTLIFWPGPDPLPNCPLADALPATLGDNITLGLDETARNEAGLAKRFALIGSRTLIPRAHAATITLLHGEATAVVGRQGLGRVVVMPIDASSLQFGSADQSNAFWNAILDPLFTLQQQTNNSYYNPSDIMASQVALDRIGDIKGVGTFGFSYVIVLIGAMMVLVGPVDYLVLKKLGRQPWTWTTVTGWIGLFTAAGLYAGFLFQSGELHFRTLQMIEQADGRIVGSNEVSLIYAPRSANYTVEAKPDSWWQPVPNGYRYGSANEGFTTPIDLAQDYRGTRPGNLWVDVWNFQFLQGRTYASAPPWIEGDLHRNGNKITGTLTNRLDRPLKRWQLAVAGYETQEFGDLQAGQTIQVDVTLKNPSTQPADVNQVNQAYSPTVQTALAQQTGKSEQQLLFEIDPLRAAAAERPPLPGAPATVQVLAQSDDIAADLTMPDAKPLEQHLAVYRATLDLQP